MDSTVRSRRGVVGVATAPLRAGSARTTSSNPANDTENLPEQHMDPRAAGARRGLSGSAADLQQPQPRRLGGGRVEAVPTVEHHVAAHAVGQRFEVPR